MIGQFTLPLRTVPRRPVVTLTDFFGWDAMLDTGALIPVWVIEERVLQKCGAKLIANNTTFTGFGGKASGNAYVIKNFKFGSLLYPDFHIVVSKTNIPAQMILPATMFDGLIYEIDTHNHALNIEIPDTQSTVRNLILEQRNGRIVVLCNNVDTLTGKKFPA